MTESCEKFWASVALPFIFTQPCPTWMNGKWVWIKNMLFSAQPLSISKRNPPALTKLEKNCLKLTLTKVYTNKNEHSEIQILSLPQARKQKHNQVYPSKLWCQRGQSLQRFFRHNRLLIETKRKEGNAHPKKSIRKYLNNERQKSYWKKTAFAQQKQTLQGTHLGLQQVQCDGRWSSRVLEEMFPTIQYTPRDLISWSSQLPPAPHPKDTTTCSKLFDAGKCEKQTSGRIPTHISA